MPDFVFSRDSRNQNMPKLTVVNRAGVEKTIEAHLDLSVMENIRNAGYEELVALCGGNCACATCRVDVDPTWISALDPMSPDEDDLLAGSDHRGPASRLSCQIYMSDSLDGLRVTIGPED
jgi:2Fe-2S ferredoxin